MSTWVSRRGRRPRHVMPFATILALALVAATANTGWADDRGESRTTWFQVSWQPGELSATIEGRVYNGSPFRAIDVRLQIEGFDAANHRAGERLVWAGDDIAPGATISYFAEAIPGAVEYRVNVFSFGLVAEAGGVVADDE
jgi:hypothetical protein